MYLGISRELEESPRIKGPFHTNPFYIVGLDDLFQG
jgi:hypothetical protein